MIIRTQGSRLRACVTAHPEGCAAHIQEWIDYVKAPNPKRPETVLVTGPPPAMDWLRASRSSIRPDSAYFSNDRPKADRNPGW